MFVQKLGRANCKSNVKVPHQCAPFVRGILRLLMDSLDRTQVDGIVQDCSNSIANALELLQSYTKPCMQCWKRFHAMTPSFSSYCLHAPDRYLQYFYCNIRELLEWGLLTLLIAKVPLKILCLSNLLLSVWYQRHVRGHLQIFLTKFLRHALHFWTHELVIRLVLQRKQFIFKAIFTISLQ